MSDIAKDRADWLLDAVACSTQNRMFLRGEPEYDDVAGDAILMCGEKAIRVALDAQATEVERLKEDYEQLERYNVENWQRMNSEKEALQTEVERLRNELATLKSVVIKDIRDWVSEDSDKL